MRKLFLILTLALSGMHTFAQKGIEDEATGEEVMQKNSFELK